MQQTLKLLNTLHNNFLSNLIIILLYKFKVLKKGVYALFSYKHKGQKDSESKIRRNAMDLLQSKTLAIKTEELYPRNQVDFALDTLFYTSKYISPQKKEATIVVDDTLIRKDIDEKKGVIIVTHHFFSMSGAAYHLSSLLKKVNTVAGYDPVLIPFWDIFKWLGYEFIMYNTGKHQKKFISQVTKALNNGEAILFVTDWFFSNYFPVLPFFNKSVHVPTGPAFFSQRCQVPIYFMKYHKFYQTHGRDKVNITFEKLPLLQSDDRIKQRAYIKETTKSLHLKVQEHICDYPDQWIYWGNTDNEQYFKKY
ncbi:MAG: hypothetical protein CMP21_08695 [Rickettsiales bacterium]|nr:hypothetical protein [Rickettsiales bacterium]|tara:strand:+ start:5162 stop:6085 length:924 start_codon:yes stop_codon:yes gene_type:complete